MFEENVAGGPPGPEGQVEGLVQLRPGEGHPPVYSTRTSQMASCMGFQAELLRPENLG